VTPEQEEGMIIGGLWEFLLGAKHNLVKKGVSLQDIIDALIKGELRDQDEWDKSKGDPK
jgi:hypothetical protein